MSGCWFSSRLDPPARAPSRLHCHRPSSSIAVMSLGLPSRALRGLSAREAISQGCQPATANRAHQDAMCTRSFLPFLCPSLERARPLAIPRPSPGGPPKLYIEAAGFARSRGRGGLNENDHEYGYGCGCRPHNDGSNTSAQYRRLGRRVLGQTRAREATPPASTIINGVPRADAGSVAMSLSSWRISASPP